jgi:hypothetical protein
LLAARELARIFVRLLGDAHALQIEHRGFFGFGLGHFAHPDRRQRQVLQHGQMRKQVEVLEHHADFAADRFDVLEVVGELDPVDHQRALLMLLQPVDAADHRRLARPRRTADHDLLAFADLEIDVLEHVEIAIPLVEFGQLDHRFARGLGGGGGGGGGHGRSLRSSGVCGG